MESKYNNRTRLSAKGISGFLRWVKVEYGPDEVSDLPERTEQDLMGMILAYIEDAERARLVSVDKEIKKLEKKRAMIQERVDGMGPQ